MAALDGGALNPCPQVVSPVLKESANPNLVALVERVRLAVLLQFVEPILSEDVEGFALRGLKHGLNDSKSGPFRASFDGQRAKPSFVARLFFSFIEHRQTGGLVDGADVRFSGGRQEAVVVLAVHPQQLDFPGAVAVRIPGGEALGVEVRRGVFASFVQRGQDVAVVAVARAKVQLQRSQYVVVLQFRPEGACREARGVGVGRTVLDVKYGTELVAILGFKAACAEFDAVHHGRVGKGEAFLLS